MKLSFANTSTPHNGDKGRLFSFKKKEWPTDDNKLKMKLSNSSGGAAFSENLRVLEGNEHPELFLLWLQDYRMKIWSSTKLTMEDKREILLRVTRNEAHSVVTRTLDLCKGRFHPNGNPIPTTFLFKHHPIKTKIAAFSDVDWLAYIAPDGAHANDLIVEAIHALKFEIFGNDSAGRSSYTKLKRQMRALRVDFSNGIRKWATRMDDFQSYLPDMLWEAGEKRGETMVPFSEMELRELLDGSLQKLHHHHLTNLDWDVLEREYNETIAKLESLEPQIILQNQHEKRLAALEGETSTGSSARKKHKGDGKRKPSKEDSAKATGEKKACPICGKFHKGECYFKNRKEAEQSRKRKWTKDTIHLVKQVLKGKHDDESTTSDSSDDSPASWKKGTSRAERAYVLGAAQAAQNCSDSDISIDSYDAKQYKKRFRKTNKKRRKR